MLASWGGFEACSIADRVMVQNEEACLSVLLSGSTPDSRSDISDEDFINDARVFVFDENGSLEACLDGKGGSNSLRLVAERHYSIFACANLEEKNAAEDLETMMQARYIMQYPYNRKSSMPMSGVVTDLYLERDTLVKISLKRLLSRLSVRMDRSRLDNDTEIMVNRVRICNCPSSAFIFQESHVGDSTGCFDIGFEATDVAPLNICGHDGLSGEISLFMLENMQGKFSEDGLSSEKDKVFDDDDARKLLCTYIEMELEYHSDSLFCTDRPLIYRFCLGDGLNSLDVERNCHYHVTICPDGDGISEDIWRIEKSGLHAYVRSILLSEQSVLLDYEGKKAEIEAKVLPSHAYCQELVWTSSDPLVASVDNEGRIMAAGEGKCTITCSSTDGSGVMASCQVSCSFAPPRFAAYPEDRYINGDIGDTIHLWCEVFPPTAPFDVGLEYLEEDRAAGIYDYIVDEDGHGVTLILKAPGSGLIYMEAGEPVNDAALYFIEVNMPDDGDLT